MDTVNWAVIGAGGIARRRTIPEGIIPAENARLVTVYDPLTGPEVAKQFGVKACAGEEELLAENIDAVYIATPTHLHASQVLRAAAAGKHVLCEKPLGMNPDETNTMVRACEDVCVKLGVGLMMRFHCQHRAALQLINDDRLGQPVFARAQLSCWYPPMDGAWRQIPEQGGGGSLVDLGAHCIDLLEMFFGRTRRVMAMTDRLVHDYASEDTAIVMLEFTNGAKGVIDCLFNVPDDACLNRLELYGSDGSILAEGTIGQAALGTMMLRARTQAAGYEAEQARDQSAGEPITPEPSNLYQAEVEAFSQSILDDSEPPVSGHDGAWNARVLQACYESAQTHQTVEL